MNKNLLRLLNELDEYKMMHLVNDLVNKNIFTLEQLVDTVVRIKNPNVISSVFKSVKDSLDDNDVSMFVDAIIKTKDSKGIYSVASELIIGNICSNLVFDLKNALLETGDFNAISSLFSDLVRCRVGNLSFYGLSSELAEILVKTKNDDYLDCVMAILGAPDVVDYVLLTEDIDYICKFSSWIWGTEWFGEINPKDKIVNWLIDTKDTGKILKFIMTVKKASVNKLIEAVIEYGTKSQVNTLRGYLTKEEKKEKLKSLEKEVKLTSVCDFNGESEQEKVTALVTLLDKNKEEELERNKEIFMELFKEPNKTKKLTK